LRAAPEAIKDWSLTTLKEKLVKIGARVLTHARYIAFKLAQVAIPRYLFVDILRVIADCDGVHGVKRPRGMSSAQTTG
jgi:hypothetical protein